MKSREASFSFKYSKVILFSSAAYGLILVLTALLGSLLVEKFYPLPEDTGAAWYYWQSGEVNPTGRIAVWIGYALHQLFVWITFFTARKKTDNKEQLKGTVFNGLMMGGNIFFVLLHFLQTHIWYDGLAMDVPIWSSQGAVIVMLVLILVMEMPRRGLFWGRWKKLPSGLLSLLHRWHGPFISWALVYTFWFHPMEGNWGLLSGFLYMFLLFIQLNLFGTKAHRNKSWVVFLEGLVVVHGTLISLYKDLEAWPLFLFGFLIMFLITQMHTWKRSGWIKIFSVIFSLVLLFGVYQYHRGWEHLHEVTFIPIALYGGAVFLWLTGKVLEKIVFKENADDLTKGSREE